MRRDGGESAQRSGIKKKLIEILLELFWLCLLCFVSSWSQLSKKGAACKHCCSFFVTPLAFVVVVLVVIRSVYLHFFIFA